MDPDTVSVATVFGQVETLEVEREPIGTNVIGTEALMAQALAS